MEKLFGIATDYGGGGWLSSGTGDGWVTALATAWAAGLAYGLAASFRAWVTPAWGGRPLWRWGPLGLAAAVAGPFAWAYYKATSGFLDELPYLAGCAAGTAALGIALAIRGIFVLARNRARARRTRGAEPEQAG